MATPSKDSSRFKKTHARQRWKWKKKKMRRKKRKNPWASMTPEQKPQRVRKMLAGRGLKPKAEEDREREMARSIRLLRAEYEKGSLNQAEFETAVLGCNGEILFEHETDIVVCIPRGHVQMKVEHGLPCDAAVIREEIVSLQLQR